MFQIELSGPCEGVEGVLVGVEVVADGLAKVPFSFSTRSWSARRVVLRDGPGEEDAPPMRSYFDLN